MATNQELRHASFRAISGTTGSYNEDMYAMCLTEVADQGSINGTLLKFLQNRLGSVSTNLPDLMNEYAISKGVTSWDELGLDAFAETALVSNRNTFPLTTVSSANYVRQSRIEAYVADNADYSGITLWYSGFGQNSGGEFSSPDAQDIRASIEFGGVTYRSAANQNCAINGLIGVSIPNVTLTQGDPFVIVTRAVGLAGTVNRIIGQGTHVIFGEGQVVGTNTGIDYTDGVYGKGAIANAPTIVGNNITACTVANGGTNYDAGPSVYAYEELADGTIVFKTIGYANRTGGAITSITITSGTPPAGLAAWTAAAVVIIGNKFSATTQVYAPAFITGIPSVEDVKSLVIIGTSIEGTFGSTDNIGDMRRNYGIVERGLANRCGILNLGSPSQIFQAFSNTTTFAKTYAAVAVAPLTHAYIGAPTNDTANGTAEASIEGYLNTIKATLAGYGIVSDFATHLPRTSGSVGSQVPATGFGAGGVALSLDTKIRNGTIASTGIGYFDLRAIFDDAGDTKIWDESAPAAMKTTDWIHANLLGIAFAENDSTWNAEFTGYE